MAILKRFKLLVDCGVRKIAADLGRKNHPQFIIEADQSLVEGCIVGPVEADSVADVEALAFVAAPRQDVGGDEELADGKAGDGAAVAVLVQDDLAEVILTTALLGGPGDFGFAAWRAFDPADAGAGDDFGGFVFGFGEQRVEALLAEWNEIGGVVVELLPHGAVQIARAFKPPDAAKFQGRIQRGEVAELHRHRARRATDALGEIDNDGLLLIELPEAELVVEIEDDEELVPRPAVSGCHE